jgi:hypothetical protein
LFVEITVCKLISVIRSGEKDCVREPELGCDQTLGESNIAKTVMLDLILLASNDVFIGMFFFVGILSTCS